MPYCVTAETSYEKIKTLITQKKIYSRLLEQIKRNFEEQIASPRRYGSIKTLSDLVECLESLDILSEYDIEGFCQIAEYLADDEISMALEKYEEPPVENNENIYALERIQEMNKKIGITDEFEKLKVVQQPLIVPEFTKSKRHAVYKIVAREIGRKWRCLGRELDVRAGDMDNMEKKHINDLQSRVFEIFDIFENDPRYSAHQHLFKICDALDNCQRKDIRRSVEKVMVNEDLK